MKLKKFIALGAAAVFAVCMAGCSRVDIAHMELEDIPDMKVGETYEMTVMFGADKEDADTAAIEEAIGEMTISYESSDEKVVTVDENGVVTAVGAGEATITVKADELTAQTDVKVAAEEETTEDADLDEDKADDEREEASDGSETAKEDNAATGTASGNANGGNNTTNTAGNGSTGTTTGGSDTQTTTPAPTPTPEPTPAPTPTPEPTPAPTPTPEPTPAPEPAPEQPTNGTSNWDDGTTNWDEGHKPLDKNEVVTIPRRDPNEYNGGNAVIGK